MKCLCCGTIHSPESGDNCTNCNFYLGSGADSAYKNQIARLIDMVAAGELTLEQFSESLAHMSRILDDMHKAALSWEEYLPSDLPDVVKNVVMKPVNVMREGIDAFGEAIELLGMYVVDPDEEHLVKGMTAANKAHNIMVNSNELAGFALREIKSQMPEGTAPTDEQLMQMISQQ